MPAFSKPEAYGRWMGRWSEHLAPKFVRFAGLAEGRRVLDVGAGTGVLGRAIGKLISQVEVIGVEPSEEYVEFARAHCQDNRLSYEVGDAQGLPFPDDSFDASLALLILQEVPDAKKVAREMRRVTRPGGLVAACQWDFRDGLPMLSLFWESVREAYPDPKVRQETIKRTPHVYSDPESLTRLWSLAGLRYVETLELDISMSFASFDDYWRPFLSGATLTSSYAATLPDSIRENVVRVLRKRLIGSGPDKPFALPARAWAVRGIVP
jgi:SAM-dependent methyltransferase